MDNKVKSFNLVTQPWINTDLGYKSLIDIFSDTSIKHLNENPIFFISIFKLCLSIFQAAYTPKDAFELKELTLSEASNKVLTYLKKWQHKFDLYGDEPFLQSKALADNQGLIKKDIKSIFLFIDYIAAGNNVVIRDLNRQYNIDDAMRAKTIVSIQICSLVGKRIFNRLCLKEQDGRSVLATCAKESIRVSPFCLNGVIYTFFQGSCILESLLLNLYTQQDIKETNLPSGLGIPIWEKDILASHGERADNYIGSYHSRLVPMLRFSCLVGDDANDLIVIDGLNYNAIIDFNVAYKIKKAKPKKQEKQTDELSTQEEQNKKINSDKIFLKTTVQKGIWTELNSILTFGKLDDFDSFKCRHFDICSKNIKICGYADFMLWTGCIFYSEKRGEQKISGNNDLISSQFVFDIDILSNGVFYKNYTDCMTLLENREKKLVDHVALFFSKGVTIDSKTVAYSKIDKKSTIVSASKVKASNMFWANVIKLKEQIISACFTQEIFDQQKSTIQEHVNAIVYKIYDDICQAYLTKEYAYIKAVLCRPVLEDILK